MDVIYIAKNGEDLGGFDMAGITEGLKTGYFMPDDLAWKEGMAAWVPLFDILNPASAQPPPLPPLLTLVAASPVPKAKSKRAKATKRIEPVPVNLATDKQLVYIRSMGGHPGIGLTVQDASTMIQSMLADPKVRAYRKERWAKEDKKREREELQREKHPWLYLHKDVLDAKAELEKCTDTDDLEGFQDDLNSAMECRIDQWRATFTTEAFETDEGAKLYEYAVHFHQPLVAQIKMILDDLDQQGGLWEKTALQSFFSRLAEKFPQLKKR